MIHDIGIILMVYVGSFSSIVWLEKKIDALSLEIFVLLVLYQDFFLIGL